MSINKTLIDHKNNKLLDIFFEIDKNKYLN